MLTQHLDVQINADRHWAEYRPQLFRSFRGQDTRLFKAVKRDIVVDIIVIIDTDRASTDTVGDSCDLVRSVDTNSKAVFIIVYKLNDLIGSLELGNINNRTKDLLNLHVFCNFGKNSSMNKVYIYLSLSTNTLSTNYNPSTALDTLLNIIENLVELHARKLFSSKGYQWNSSQRGL